MTRSQQLALAISEHRQALNKLANKEGLTAEEQAEIEERSAKLDTAESQYRAAVRAEQAEEGRRNDSDGESAEAARLGREARAGEYLSAAMAGRPVTGAEAELNAARGLEPLGLMPWDAVAPREARSAPGGAEHRADTATSAPATGNPQTQAEILDRVFAPSLTQFLGVDMPSVPIGTASYPVFATGAAGAFAAKGVEQGAEEATFSVNTINPARLSARYLWRIEDSAGVLRGMEEALRGDLSMALSDRFDRQILDGDDAGANLSGFLHDGGVLGAEPAAPGTPADFDAYSKILRDEVDGIYARGEGDIRIAAGPDWYKHAGTKYRATEGDVSANDYLRTRSGGYVISAHFPAQDAGARMFNSALLAKGPRGAATAPIWQGLRLIRDEVTGAAKGEIALTAIALYGFRILRAAQYSWVKASTA